MSPSKFLGIPESYSYHGSSVDHIIDVVHWFMIALFVGWTLFFLFCLWRFRQSKHPKASYEGVRIHLSTHVEIGVIIIEAVLLLGFAFPLWADRTDSWEQVQRLKPVRVRVVGWQFGWTYHYPGSDGKFGRTDGALISGTNDLGIDYSDPNALDDFTSPMLKLPVDRPAVLNVGSKDVIHNYSIIPMRIQQDAIPGKEIPMWFTPIKTLETFVVCGQLCGEGHGNMVGTMEVIGKKEFDEWETAQTKTALEANQKAAAAKSSASPAEKVAPAPVPVETEAPNPGTPGKTPGSTSTSPPASGTPPPPPGTEKPGVPAPGTPVPAPGTQDPATGAPTTPSAPAPGAPPSPDATVPPVKPAPGGQ
jgi:cytochrome c oxidase subunit II